MFVRREELPRINPIRFMEQAGFMKVRWACCVRCGGDVLARLNTAAASSAPHAVRAVRAAACFGGHALLCASRSLPPPPLPSLLPLLALRLLCSTLLTWTTPPSMLESRSSCSSTSRPRCVLGGPGAGRRHLCRCLLLRLSAACWPCSRHCCAVKAHPIPMFGHASAAPPICRPLPSTHPQNDTFNRACAYPNFVLHTGAVSAAAGYSIDRMID